MIDGWRREHWKHTSAVMWIVAEVNRNSKARKKAYPIDQFSPYAQHTSRDGTAVTPASIQVLKVFLPAAALAGQ